MLRDASMASRSQTLQRALSRTNAVAVTSASLTFPGRRDLHRLPRGLGRSRRDECARRARDGSTHNEPHDCSLSASKLFAIWAHTHKLCNWLAAGAATAASTTDSHVYSEQNARLTASLPLTPIGDSPRGAPHSSWHSCDGSRLGVRRRNGALAAPEPQNGSLVNKAPRTTHFILVHTSDGTERRLA